MKKIDRVRKAIFALSFWAFAGMVQATPTPIDLGSIGPSGIVPVDVALPAKGSFSDLFTFTLLSGNSADISLLTFFSGNPAVDAPAITFELSGVSGAGQFAPDVFVDDLSFLANMTFTGLTAGKQYILGISGSDASYLGENYSVQMAAHRIPEPATLLLVFASLGLMGVATRFQQNNKKANS